jgi:protein gp37
MGCGATDNQKRMSMAKRVEIFRNEKYYPSIDRSVDRKMGKGVVDTRGINHPLITRKEVKKEEK